MKTPMQVREPYEDEIDLRELVPVIWAGRWLVFFTTAALVLISVLYALSLPNQYQAHVLLAPAKQDAGNMSSKFGQFSGLASLAGINIGGGQGSEAGIAVEVMQSRGFIQQYIKQSGIVVEIMAVKRWHKKDNRLVIDTNKYDVSTKQWVRTPPSGRTKAPSLWEAYEVFSDMLLVSKDKKTGLVNVSIEYFSPYLARQWVENYILAINLFLQQRKLVRIETNIKYLEEQIAITSVAEMRQIFFTLIEEQIKTKMLVEATPDYAFTTVSQAMLPEEKSQPKRALMVVLGGLLGLMISLCVVMIRHYWDNNCNVE